MHITCTGLTHYMYRVSYNRNGTELECMQDLRPCRDLDFLPHAELSHWPATNCTQAVYQSAPAGTSASLATIYKFVMLY